MLKGERIILSCSFIPLRRLIFLLFVIVHLWTLIYFLIHGNNIFIAEYNSHVINNISFLVCFFVIVFLKCLTWIFPGSWASLVAQLVKNLLAMQETWVRSLDWEEGNGYLLQYSGLENSMDRIVHGVTKSWTRPCDFHFTFIQEFTFNNEYGSLPGGFQITPVFF